MGSHQIRGLRPGVSEMWAASLHSASRMSAPYSRDDSLHVDSEPSQRGAFGFQWVAHLSFQQECVQMLFKPEERGHGRRLEVALTGFPPVGGGDGAEIASQ